MANKIINYGALEKKLRSGERYEMHRIFAEAVEVLKDEIPDDTLRGFIAAFLAGYKIEDTIFKYDPAAVETPQLKEADHLRDEDITYLDSRVKTAALHDPDPERKAKAKLLQHIFKNYKKMKRKAYPEQTGWVWAALKELDKPENKAVITFLGLTDAVTAIRTANGTFEQLWGERAHAYDEARKLGTLTDAQKRTYKAFSGLATYINALALAGNLPDAQAEALATAIDVVNAQLTGLAHALRQRGKKVKLPGPGEPPDITDPPVDPNGPTDPQTPDITNPPAPFE